MAGVNPLWLMYWVWFDFCATAMNKIFGKRQEVAAVYVDLDKDLEPCPASGEDLSDQDIEKLAEQAGYRIVLSEEITRLLAGEYHR